MSDNLNERSITLIRICRCGLVFAAGICACGAALGIDHTFEASRPSDMTCIQSEVGHDLALPLGCDDNSSPHNRTGWYYSLATASSSSSMTGVGMFWNAPTVAFTAIDAEAAAERAAKYDQMGMVNPPPNFYAYFEYDGPAIAVVHPTKDERLTLIQQSSKPVV